MDIIGIRAVTEALREGSAAQCLVVSDAGSPKLREILSMAESAGLEVRENPAYFSKFRAQAQGVALVVPEYRYRSLDELLARPAAERGAICALDCIQDVGNLGSILRAASVFGIRAIVVPKDRSAKITPAVVKTAQGGLADVEVVMVTNLSRALEALKKAGYWIAACHMEGEDVRGIPDAPVCFVIGGEHSGIRENVRKHCDFTFAIPMARGSSVGCLNAASAATIFFYEYSRKER